MRIKRAVVTLILVILFFVLQNTLLNYIKFSSACPDICLILIVTIAFFNGSSYGTVFGFIMGLLCDVFLSGFPGFYSLLYVLTGYLCGLLNKTFFDYNFELKLPLILFSVTCLVHNFITYIFFYLLNGDLNIKYYFQNLILPEVLYTLIAGALIYRVLYMIDQKLSLDERKADGYFVS